MFRLVKLYIIWSSTSESNCINGPKTFNTSSKNDKMCQRAKKSSPTAKCKTLIRFGVYIISEFQSFFH